MLVRFNDAAGASCTFGLWYTALIHGVHSMGLHCRCAAQTIPRHLFVCAQLIDSNEWNVIFRMVDRKKVKSGKTGPRSAFGNG